MIFEHVKNRWASERRNLRHAALTPSYKHMRPGTEISRPAAAEPAKPMFWAADHTARSTLNKL